MYKSAPQYLVFNGRKGPPQGTNYPIMKDTRHIPPPLPTYSSQAKDNLKNLQQISIIKTPTKNVARSGKCSLCYQ